MVLGLGRTNKSVNRPPVPSLPESGTIWQPSLAWAYLLPMGGLRCWRGATASATGEGPERRSRPQSGWHRAPGTHEAGRQGSATGTSGHKRYDESQVSQKRNRDQATIQCAPQIAASLTREARPANSPHMPSANGIDTSPGPSFVRGTGAPKSSATRRDRTARCSRSCSRDAPRHPGMSEDRTGQSFGVRPSRRPGRGQESTGRHTPSAI
jgi:hypothetical protein